ncbi:MAG: hypothetical protein M1535_03840 [Candidatus Thermoplasmatota archaeon]|nr:hypothetical protein [Candidatus Thermoplasmatota archaeon]
MNRSESGRMERENRNTVSENELAEFNFCNVSWYYSRKGMTVVNRRGTVPYSRQPFPQYASSYHVEKENTGRKTEITISLIAALIGIAIMIIIIFF